MDVYNTLRKEVIESATLLWAFDKLPERSMERTICRTQTGWTLLAAAEQQLAEDFAFISCAEDNSDRILAVCIEEEDDGDLIARLACNRGEIATIVSDLQVIADMMVKATCRELSQRESEMNMVERIVAMCRKRILSRLRSRHAPKTIKIKDRPALSSLLMRTVLESSRPRRTPEADSAAERILSQCEHFNNTFQSLEDAKPEEDTLPWLFQLVVQASEFDIAGLVGILHSNKTINPSTETYLPRALRKLGNYHQVARNLCKAARTSKHNMFQKITVLGVQWNAIESKSLRAKIEGFDVVLARTTDASRVKCSLGTLQEARKKYKDRVGSSKAVWRVHAEIQLLLFYQLSPQRQWPRVVAASKSACYLCDMFLAIHGKFRVPRTHGRLYDRWTLPELTGNQASVLQHINPVLMHMSRILAKNIASAVTGSRSTRAPPCESVVELCHPWSSNSTLRPAESKTVLASIPAEDSPCVPEASNRTYVEDLDPIAATDSCSQASEGNSSDTVSCAETTCSSVLAPCLRKEVEMEKTIHFQTSAMEIGVAMVQSSKTVTDGKWESFLVSVAQGQVVENSPCAGSATLVLDLGCLLPDQEVTLPVGAATASNRLICRSNGQEVELTFELP